MCFFPHVVLEITYVSVTSGVHWEFQSELLSSQSVTDIERNQAEKRVA